MLASSFAEIGPHPWNQDPRQREPKPSHLVPGVGGGGVCPAIPSDLEFAGLAAISTAKVKSSGSDLELITRGWIPPAS